MSSAHQLQKLRCHIEQANLQARMFLCSKTHSEVSIAVVGINNVNSNSDVVANAQMHEYI